MPGLCIMIAGVALLNCSDAVVYLLTSIYAFKRAESRFRSGRWPDELRKQYQ